MCLTIKGILILEILSMTLYFFQASLSNNKAVKVKTTLDMKVDGS